MEKNPVNIVFIKQKGQSPLDLAKSIQKLEIINLIEEWTTRNSINRGTTFNIVEIN